jgi:glycogen operon protein
MLATLPGRSFPLGATPSGRGVNFSVYSKFSAGMELLLFDGADDAAPAQVISLDPRTNRTFYYWHVFVPGIKPGQIYAFRANGPYDPARGLRFDARKVLLDPYGRAVVFPRLYDRGAASRPGDNTPYALKSAVVDTSSYDWNGDLPLHRSFASTVIYEMHVGGFTCHLNSGIEENLRGTYAGLVKKIPYLTDLGVTAVELLPVYAFDPQDAPPGLSNYWGYSPISFFAPHPFYSSRRDPLGPLNEFRDMVKLLHRAGIEVILDVVYNHTGENGVNGPTLSMRGLGNETYYILEEDKSRYANFTGTGNTLNANNSFVRGMILDSLRYWVAEVHVDGFRFDLASILSRDEKGTPLANPPILLDIEADPTLAGTKLIAEAWDAAGLYQVGSFVGDRWKEWNGKFRDDIRRWVKGGRGSVETLPNRLLASPDLYAHENREPDQSVNFVACHDGFTLNDVVSYNSKHNEANREFNRDGNDDNYSFNYGVEGPSEDPVLEGLRERQIKNFFAYTLLAMGSPMLQMGDEVRRTQRGNNNAYCQDNEISWFDWSLVEKYAGLFRFVRELIRFRLHFAVDPEDDFKSLTQILQEATITWHGTRLNQPDWGLDSHSLAVTIANRGGKRATYFIFNTYDQELDFELPELPDNRRWRRVIDTNLAPPDDLIPPFRAARVHTASYLAAAHSVVVLVADLE